MKEEKNQGDGEKIGEVKKRWRWRREKKKKMLRKMQRQEKTEIILHMRFTIQGRLDNRQLWMYRTVCASVYV